VFLKWNKSFLVFALSLLIAGSSFAANNVPPAPNQLQLVTHLTCQSLDELEGILMPSWLLQGQAGFVFLPINATGFKSRFLPMLSDVLIPAGNMNCASFTLGIAFLIDKKHNVPSSAIVTAGMNEEWFALKKGKSTLLISFFGNDEDTRLQLKPGQWNNLLLSFDLENRRILVQLNNKTKELKLDRNTAARALEEAEKVDPMDKVFKFYSLKNPDPTERALSAVIHPQNLPVANNEPVRLVKKIFQPEDYVFHGILRDFFVGGYALSNAALSGPQKYTLIEPWQDTPRKLKTISFSGDFCKLAEKKEFSEEPFRKLFEAGFDVNGAVKIANRPLFDKLPGSSLPVFHDNVCTPLMAAIYYNNEKLFDFLLKEGANPDKMHSAGYTALFYAVWLNRNGMVKRMLESGANPNLSVKNKPSPLCIAVLNNNLEAAEWLLAKGAEPNVIFGEDPASSPLLVAIKNNSLPMVKLLLENKASTRLDGVPSPLTAVLKGPDANKNEIVELLVKNGVKVTTSDINAARDPALKKLLREARQR